MRIEYEHGLARVYGNERPRREIWFVAWGLDTIRVAYGLCSRSLHPADRVPDDIQ